MENITPPTKLTITPLENEFEVEAVLSPCYPGYGSTVANALRRVLLSSLPGSAIIAVKIRGVQHEFSTIEHVTEDVVEIIMNLKRLRVKTHTDEQHILRLNVTGKKEVTGADFEKNSDVEVTNPAQPIATLTSKDANLEMEVYIGHGVGYIPVEQQIKDEYDIGVIAIDSFFSPVKHVGSKIENVRVGKRTDYDKVKFNIITDGTITAEDALKRSGEILVE
ncbi:MAG: DNA-directed RNA polymerase subunit alpha, partial [Candidatus Jacksonbacteria bacterium]|nr:DNA-directed RNA polymerase subunit alpha [Candidatus Jacksonbacteria bacterium]